MITVAVKTAMDSSYDGLHILSTLLAGLCWLRGLICILGGLPKVSIRLFLGQRKLSAGALLVVGFRFWNSSSNLLLCRVCFGIQISTENVYLLWLIASISSPCLLRFCSRLSTQITFSNGLLSNDHQLIAWALFTIIIQNKLTHFLLPQEIVYQIIYKTTQIGLYQRYASTWTQ